MQPWPEDKTLLISLLCPNLGSYLAPTQSVREILWVKVINSLKISTWNIWHFCVINKSVQCTGKAVTPPPLKNGPFWGGAVLMSDCAVPEVLSVLCKCRHIRNRCHILHSPSDNFPTGLNKFFEYFREREWALRDNFRTLKRKKSNHRQTTDRQRRRRLVQAHRNTQSNQWLSCLDELSTPVRPKAERSFRSGWTALLGRS